VRQCPTDRIAEVGVDEQVEVRAALVERVRAARRNVGNEPSRFENSPVLRSQTPRSLTASCVQKPIAGTEVLVP